MRGSADGRRHKGNLEKLISVFQCSLISVLYSSNAPDQGNLRGSADGSNILEVNKSIQVISDTKLVDQSIFFG